MKAFDWQLQKKGYIPMAGQIVDASLVPAPKQRNTDGEKEAIKAGKTAREIWPDEPNKAAQKDTSARWTLKIGGKVRYRPDGTPLPMIAVPVFGYKSHISIDRRFGFIRESAVTSASAADGRMLRRLVTTENTGRRRLGRQRLPLAKQREMAGREHADEPDPPPQACGQADAAGDGQWLRPVSFAAAGFIAQVRAVPPLVEPRYIWQLLVSSVLSGPLFRGQRPSCHALVRHFHLFLRGAHAALLSALDRALRLAVMTDVLARLQPGDELVGGIPWTKAKRRRLKLQAAMAF